MTNAVQIHQLLLAKASELGLPNCFVRDLTVHDLNSLTEAPEGQVMLWGLGECGTHMIRLKGTDSPRYWMSLIHGMDHWFVIQDGQLQEVEKNDLPSSLEEFNEKMSKGVFSPADEDQANSRLTRITDKKGTK